MYNCIYDLIYKYDDEYCRAFTIEDEPECIFGDYDTSIIYVAENSAIHVLYGFDSIVFETYYKNDDGYIILHFIQKGLNIFELSLYNAKGQITYPKIIQKVLSICFRLHTHFQSSAFYPHYVPMFFESDIP